MIRYTEMPKDEDEFIRLTVKALVAQGGPSVIEGGEHDGLCDYRGAEGRACAVGFWLSEEEAEACAGLGAECVYKDMAEALPRIFKQFDVDTSPLIGVQYLHDGASRVYKTNVRARGMEPRRAWYDALYAEARDPKYIDAITAAIREYEQESAK